MGQTKKTFLKSSQMLTSIDEFEQLFFPRAYQEKRKELDEDRLLSLGVAVDFLGEVQRHLPKKRAQQKVTQAKS